MTWGREICMALLHPMKLSIYMVLGVPIFLRLIGDQDGDMASMHDVEAKVCGLIRVFGELLFHGSSLWTQTHQARTQNTCAIFGWMQIDDLMWCDTRPAFNMCYGSFGPELSCTALVSNLLRCILWGGIHGTHFFGAPFWGGVRERDYLCIQWEHLEFNGLLLLCGLLSMYRSDSFWMHMDDEGNSM